MKHFFADSKYFSQRFHVEDQVNPAQCTSKISRECCTRRKNHSAQLPRVAGLIIVGLGTPKICGKHFLSSIPCPCDLPRCAELIKVVCRAACCVSDQIPHQGSLAATSRLCAWFGVLIKTFITEIGALRQGNCSSGCQILHYLLFFNFRVMVEHKVGCSCLSSNRK